MIRKTHVAASLIVAMVLGTLSAPCTPAPQPGATLGEPAAKAVAPATAPTVAPSPERLVVGYATTGATLLPLFMAAEEGIFQKYGIDIDVQFLPASAGPMAALLSGNLDVMNISGETITANLAGSDVVYIAATMPAPLFSLHGDPAIKTAAGLRGKRIGITGKATATENAAIYVLRSAGLNPDTDATLVTTGDTASSVAALSGGSADAAIFSPPNTLQAEAAGFPQIADAVALGWKYPSAWSTARRTEADRKPDLMRRYVQALVEGTALTQRNKEAAIRVLSKYTKIEDEKILDATYAAYAPKLLRVPLPPAESVEAGLKFYAATIPAAAEAKPERFVYDRFVKELQASGFIDRAFR